MTAPAPLHPQLLQALHRPHEAAAEALGDGRADSLAAVTWVATHLGAVARVLHPVLSRRLPEGGPRVRVLADVDRQLQRALWRLDRRLTGDVHAAAGEVATLEHAVEVALRQHVRHEATAPPKGAVPPIPKRAEASPPPPAGKPPPAKNADSGVAPSPIPQGRGGRWAWYVGGGAAALCVRRSVCSGENSLRRALAI